MNNRDKKNILIVALLIAVVFMSVGYALLSEQLKVEGTTDIKGISWDIGFTDIKGIETTGAGVSLSSEITSSLSGSFNASLTAPGDSVTYNVVVDNKGTVDVVVDNVVMGTKSGTNESGYVVYEVEGVEAGMKILAGEKLTFNFIVKYNPNMDATADEISEISTLILDVSQAK